MKNFILACVALLAVSLFAGAADARPFRAFGNNGVRQVTVQRVNRNGDLVTITKTVDARGRVLAVQKSVAPSARVQVFGNGHVGSSVRGNFGVRNFNQHGRRPVVVFDAFGRAIILR